MCIYQWKHKSNPDIMILTQYLKVLMVEPKK